MRYGCENTAWAYGILTILVVEIQGLERITSDDECGKVDISRSNGLARIVNGSSSVSGQWPWQAAIFIERSQSLVFTCGAVVINKSWVLTAAHCFDDDPISSINVYLGINNRSDELEAPRQIRQLKNMTCYPGFIGESNFFKDDLCLLHLDEPVSYSTYIRPACLPENGSSVGVGVVCVISGWGDTEGTGDDSILRYAEVPIVSRTTCSTWYREVLISIPEKHFCAGYEAGGTDACQGDSGGPLVCSETISGRKAYVLRGITSFGAGCAEPRRPGVYVDVVQYLSWINEVVASRSMSIYGNTRSVFLLCFYALLARVLRSIFCEV